MPLWKRFWLLASGTWGVVCVLNAVTILAFSEGEGAKAVQPLVLALAGPAALYGVLWLYFRLRRR
jgi:hypothetical protein